MPPRRPPLVSLALFGAWLALVLFLASRHVYWRDEVRAYSIATEPDSLSAMVRLLRADGHPSIWYLMLRAAAAVLPKAAVLPVLSVTIAACAVALLLFASPLPTLLVGLLMFGAAFAYEYSVMARNYGISALLIFVFAVVYGRSRQIPCVIGLALALLANTNVVAALIAGILLAFYGAEWLRDRRSGSAASVPVLVSNLLLAGAGLACAFVTVYPPPATSSVARSVVSLASLAQAVLLPAGPLGSLVLREPWAYLGLPGLADSPPLQLAMSALLFATALSLSANINALLAYLASLVGMSLFFATVYGGGYRHQALLIMVLIGLMWIVRAETRPVAVSNRVGRCVGIGDVALYIVLVLQIPAAGHQVSAAIRGLPASASAQLAALLAQPRFRQAIVMAEPDYVVEAVPYYSGNRLYFSHDDRIESFNSQLAPKIPTQSLGDLVAKANKLRTAYGAPILLVLQQPIGAEIGTDRALHAGNMWSLVLTEAGAKAFREAFRPVATLAARSDERYDVFELK